MMFIPYLIATIYIASTPTNAIDKVKLRREKLHRKNNAIKYSLYEYSPDASVAHASGSRQLPASTPVAVQKHSSGMSTRRAVATLGSNDLVVGEDHMVWPSCLLCNWHTGRWGLMGFGCSSRSGRTVTSNPNCLAGVFPCGKDFRRQSRGKIRSGISKSGLTLNSGLYAAAPIGGGSPCRKKPVWCPRAGGSRRTGSPAEHCNHQMSHSSQTLLCHRIC